MVSFSAVSFSTLHSSVRYLISFYTILTTVYFVVSKRTHHFPLAHCSQVNLEDFFSLVYLSFSSQAYNPFLLFLRPAQLCEGQCLQQLSRCAMVPLWAPWQPNSKVHKHCFGNQTRKSFRNISYFHTIKKLYPKATKRPPPLVRCYNARVLEMWRGVVKGGWSPPWQWNTT